MSRELDSIDESPILSPPTPSSTRHEIPRDSTFSRSSFERELIRLVERMENRGKIASTKSNETFTSRGFSDFSFSSSFFRCVETPHSHTRHARFLSDSSRRATDEFGGTPLLDTDPRRSSSRARSTVARLRFAFASETEIVERA